MTLVHRDRMQTLLGDYAVGGPDCLVDPSVVQLAQDYRRRAQAWMQPLDPADMEKNLPPAEYLVSLKIDGEFNLLVYDRGDQGDKGFGQAILVNPGGTVRAGLPCLSSAARILFGAEALHAVVAAELYAHYKPNVQRARVHDVNRMARNPQSRDDVHSLDFMAFDVLEPTTPGVRNSWAQLRRWNLTTPPYVWCHSAAEIKKHFDKWVRLDGHEGIVIRSDTAGSFKVKPRHSIDAVVIGFTLDPDDPGRLHDLLVALMRPDGCYQVLGRVGGGFTDQDRRDWACDLKDLIVPSDYAEVNDGVAYQFVWPKHMIEISCLDVIAQSTRGQPIQAMCLAWDVHVEFDDDEDSSRPVGSWNAVRKLPLAAMISPQFVRLRQDKGVNERDLRLSQVTDLVEVPLATADARQFELPKSEVLKRQVWTKKQKDKEMVRKLVMYATHKAAADYAGRDWPAFVIAITDYSSGRKEPLDRDVRVSDSREQIEAMWNELVLEKGAVKGWTPA